jgi:CheY-like chemotaxis protein
MTIKLLVADDSATIQKVVSLAFSDEDVIIETVSSGYAAMNSARIFKPDVVLADVLMPGGSGYEVCERIKQDPELAGTPVILMVGAFESFDEVEASRVKCDGHLTKPFDTSELIQMVHSLVENKTVLHKSEDTVESAVGPVLPHAPSMQNMKGSIVGFADPRVLNSFLGSDRILELFEPETLALAQTMLVQKTENAVTDLLAQPKDQYSENFFNLVVDRVVQQMSQDVIREVAWEVVPELSEILLRRFIEEHRKA